MRRRLLRRFVLDTLESRKFEVSVRTWQRQMPMGCVQERMPLLPLVSVPLLWHTTYDAIKVGVVHIGVGLCVVVLLVWAMRGPQCVEQLRAGKKHKHKNTKKQCGGVVQMENNLCFSVYGELYVVDLDRMLYF